MCMNWLAIRWVGRSGSCHFPGKTQPCQVRARCPRRCDDARIARLISAEGKAHQARPADQLCQRFCPRRRRRSCGISDRDLLDGGRGCANEIKCIFRTRQMLLYDSKHLMGLPMRYSKEHKLETHARIVKKASVRLREKGAHGVGVADLMKEAGLTHGGFYAHFDSREALVIEAFADAMDRSIAHWRKKAEQTPIDKRLAAIVDSYLTPTHRDDPGHGCAIPALSAEIARESPKTRKAFAAKLEQMVEMLAAQIPDVPRKTARKQAMASLATMMGTLVLARVAGSGEFSGDILEAGREAVLDRAAAKLGGKKPASKRAAVPA